MHSQLDNHGPNESRATLRYSTIDAFICAFLTLLLVLVLLFPQRLDSPGAVFDRLLITLGGYVVMVMIMHRFSSGLRAGLRIATLATLLIYLFDEMQYFQMLLFDSWLDAVVLSGEESLFGGNVVSLLQSYVHPYVTEGLMFTYVLYVGVMVAPLIQISSISTQISEAFAGLDVYLLRRPYTSPWAEKAVDERPGGRTVGSLDELAAILEAGGPQPA